jgi:hypothetical protein
MLIDHIGVFFFPGDLYFRAIGRLSAPIWLFFAGMHYSGKVSKRLVAYALFVIATLTLIKGQLVYSNILISIILVKYLVAYIDRKQFQQKIQYFEFYILWLGFALLLITNPFIEYGSVSLIFAYCGYLHKIGFNPKRTAYFFIGTIIIYLVSQNEMLHFPSIPALVTGILFPPLLAALYWFKTRKISVSGLNSGLIKFFSRYSLEIYAFHYIIFNAIWQYNQTNP